MDDSLLSPTSSRHHWTKDDIQEKIKQSDIIVFSKGTEDNPCCGFSERVLSILRHSGRSFKVIDVNEDASIKPALRSFSGHRELPLVYINGNLTVCDDKLGHTLNEVELKAKLERVIS